MADNGAILVTGAPGQLGAVGRTVTGLLLDRGLPVRAMVRRDDDRAAGLRAAGAEVVLGDLLEPADVYRVVSGCRRVYFGMSVSVGYLEATVTMAAVAREVGVDALVNMSQMTDLYRRDRPADRDVRGPTCSEVERKDSHMSTTSTRLFLGFLSGSLSHLIFQGGLGSILYAAHLIPALPWSLMPVPPLGVPKSLSLALWAGLWGLVYAVLEPRLTALVGWWAGGLVFGIALPLVVYWFVVLPLKGAGVGGGFHLAMVPIEVAFHAIFGIGLAIIFRSGLALVRRSVMP